MRDDSKDRPQPSLTSQFRTQTSLLHRVAERSGFVRNLLRGTADRDGYALYLRNLLPAYQQLEEGLRRHGHKERLKRIGDDCLFRTAALRSDLEALCGPDWDTRLSVLRAGDRYAQQVEVAAEGNGERLIAHAYVRYLGDLNGGQTLRRLLARTPGLEAAALNFYEFPAIADIATFKGQYSVAIDDTAPTIVDRNGVIDEAVAAFRLNIDVSEAVQKALSFAAPDVLAALND